MAEETKTAEELKQTEETKAAEEQKINEEAETAGTVPEEIKMAQKHKIEYKVGEEEKPEVKPDAEKEAAEEIRKKPLDQITEEESRKLTKNEQGYYWAAKKERIKRQNIESEKQLADVQMRGLREEKERLAKALEAYKNGDPEELAKLEEKTNEDGRMTEEEWKKVSEKKNEEKRAQTERLNNRLAEFEIEAKVQYEDFDNTVDLATDIFNNYKTIFTDEVKQKEIEGKLKEWTKSAADIMGENPKNIAVLAYEIGKLHPKYGAKADKDGETLSDEKMKKLMDNQKKGRTSASLGGSAGIAGTDITPEMAVNMTMAQWRKLPKETKIKLLGGT